MPGAKRGRAGAAGLWQHGELGNAAARDEATAKGFLRAEDALNVNLGAEYHDHTVLQVLKPRFSPKIQ